MEFPLLTPRQAAELLGVSGEWLMRQVSERRIPHFAIRGRVRFERGAILAWQHREARAERAHQARLRRTPVPVRRDRGPD